MEIDIYFTWSCLFLFSKKKNPKNSMYLNAPTSEQWDIIHDANKCKEKVVVENSHLITVSVMLSNVKSVVDLQLSLDELSTLSLLTPSYSIFFSPSLSTFPPLALYAINQKVIRAWWFDVRPLVLLDWHLMQL